MSVNSNAKPIVRRRRVATSRRTEIPTLLTVPDLRPKSDVTLAHADAAIDEATVAPEANEADSYSNQAGLAPLLSPLAMGDEPRTEFGIDPPKQVIGATEQAATHTEDTESVPAPKVIHSVEPLRNAISTVWGNLGKTGITTIRPGDWFSGNWRKEIGTLGTIAAAILTCTLVARSLRPDHSYRDAITAKVPDSISESLSTEDSNSQTHDVQGSTPMFEASPLREQPFAQPVGDSNPSPQAQQNQHRERPNGFDRVARVPTERSSFSPMPAESPTVQHERTNVDPWARPAFGGQPSQPRPVEGTQMTRDVQLQRAGHFQVHQPSNGAHPQNHHVPTDIARNGAQPSAQPSVFSTPVQLMRSPQGASVGPEAESTQRPSHFNSSPAAHVQSNTSNQIHQHGIANRYESTQFSPSLPPLPNRTQAATAIESTAGYPVTPSHYRPLNQVEAALHNQQVAQQHQSPQPVGLPQGTDRQPVQLQADQRGTDFGQDHFFNNNGGVRR